MVQLDKLHGVIVPVEFRNVYKHYLEQEGTQEKIKLAYNQLTDYLDTNTTSKRFRLINQAIRSKTKYENFSKKVFNYFFRIIYVLVMEDYDQLVSIKTCINDAIGYAVAEYMALSIIKFAS